VVKTALRHLLMQMRHLPMWHLLRRKQRRQQPPRKEEHAMNELIEKEGSSWWVDPGAAPGPALSPAPAPAPPWGSLRLRHGEVSVTLALFELSRRRAARIAIWDSDL